jgi:biopolymer transport protein ExbD
MRRKHPMHAAGEPDLIPVMNLVCLLIPFLLLTATFVQYAVIHVTSPRFVPGPGQVETDPGLDLTVLVTDEGFTLSTRGRTLGTGPTVPVVHGPGRAGHDYASLTARLRQIKDDNEGESRINIGAERNIDYDIVVKVMDATREDGSGELFPDVVLLAGVI